MQVEELREELKKQMMTLIDDIKHGTVAIVSMDDRPCEYGLCVCIMKFFNIVTGPPYIMLFPYLDSINGMLSSTLDAHASSSVNYFRFEYFANSDSILLADIPSQIKCTVTGPIVSYKVDELKENIEQFFSTSSDNDILQIYMNQIFAV